MSMHTVFPSVQQHARHAEFVCLCKDFRSWNLNFQASAFGPGRERGRRGGFREKNLSPQPLENQPLSGKCQKNSKKRCEKVW
jgi:hypothetical protein